MQSIDLAGQQARIRRIAGLRARHPKIRTRTFHMLTGKLEALPMALDKTLNLRIDPEIIRRAEALLPEVAKDETLAAAGRVSVSTVLRLALLRGMDQLAKKYRK